MGENGSSKAISTTASDVASSVLLGRLRKNLPRVRMMNITRTCVASDSMNQPVWNSFSPASNTFSKMKKVMKSNSELTGPMTSMKFRMNDVSQCRGRSRELLSTVSIGIGSSDTSYSRLLSNICTGSIGRKGRNSVAPAMLNMLPKLELVPIMMYFMILTCVRRPSSTPV